MGGAEDVQQAIKLIEQARILFKSAKMDLRKWITNNNKLRNSLQGVLHFLDNTMTMAGDTDVTTKALGVTWDPRTDTLQFKPEKVVEDANALSKRPTKRKLFRPTLRIFDQL